MFVECVCYLCGCTDSRQTQPTKGQDAPQLQALIRPHSMQNHTKKQHNKSFPVFSRGDFNAPHLSWYSRSTDTRGMRTTDSTDLIMVSPHESCHMHNRVLQMSNQLTSSTNAPGRPSQPLAQTIYQSSLDYRRSRSHTQAYVEPMSTLKREK